MDHRINSIQNQISFITRSFDPDHHIKLDLTNSIIDIDEGLTSFFGINLIGNSTELFEPTLYDLMLHNPLNTMEFISILKHNVQLNNPCIVALSVNVSVLTRLAIPCIYLFVMVPAISDKVRVLNFYNLLSVARKFQELFSGGFLTKPISSLGNSLSQRSVYFAFEALKSFTCFTQQRHFTHTSDTGMFLADLLKSFQCKSNQKDDKLYRLRLFKSDGYIERNQYKYSMQISEELSEKIKSIPAIPFNALNQNLIFSL